MKGENVAALLFVLIFLVGVLVGSYFGVLR
jgi:hypothetical protein